MVLKLEDLQRVIAELPAGVKSVRLSFDIDLISEPTQEAPAVPLQPKGLELLYPADLVARLKRSKSTVKRMLRKEIPGAFQRHGRWCVRSDDFEEFMRTLSAGTPTAEAIPRVRAKQHPKLHEWVAARDRKRA